MRTTISLAGLAMCLTLSATPVSAGTESPWHLYQAPVAGQATLDAAVSPGRQDAWAAGFTIASSSTGTGSSSCFDVGFLDSLMLHWNGRTWQRVTVPDLGRINNMSAASPADVWASADCGLLHWNGKHWAVSSYPVPKDAQQPAPGNIVADQPDDAWLLGSTYDAATQVAGEFVDHWNGRVWRLMPLPDLGTDATLDAVDARGPDDVWVAGTASTSDQPDQFLLLHWNGHSWQQSRQPSTGMWTKFVTGVTMLSADDVWVVGWGKTAPAGDEPRHPIALHWDGRNWTNTAVPSGRGEVYQMVQDDGDLWAVGDTYSPTATTYTMDMLRWTGNRWVNSAVPVSGEGSLFSAAPVPDGGMWVVGATGSNAPVIARRR
ncbi:MAG: hypothetical protein ABSA93_00775 [Streptosporangiaceae bacterium]|jgi:hypothetical protein